MTEVEEIAHNIIRNGGISKDHAKYALDIVNPQIKDLALAYLDLLTWMKNVPTDSQLDGQVPSLDLRTGRQLLS
jgi:hypothetical protein